MPGTVALLGLVAVGSVLAARLLTGARWSRRSPALAIALWQALGLGWGLATVGAITGLGTLGLHEGGRLSSLAADAGQAVWMLAGLGRPASRPWSLAAGLRLFALGAGTVLLAVLCWILLAAIAAVMRARHRQLSLLGLLAHGDPKVPGALVVDHPAAAAYCVPGLRSAIVFSAGTLSLLDQAELAAVLAHERAHLRARHDLVLLPFTALLRAFRWSATARDANREVALLVEMLADDRARRHRPARELATALLRVGAAGAGVAPAGALAAAAAASENAARPGAASGQLPASGQPAASAELAARVIRLLRPPPGLPAPAAVLVAAVTAALVITPVAALLLPI